MSSIEKIKKNMEEIKIKMEENKIKYAKRKEILKEQEEERKRLYEKVEKLIKDGGGISNFMNIVKEEFKNKTLFSIVADKEKPKWEFNEDKLVNRIEYSNLSVENKMEILKKNIKENIKEKIKEERLEGIEETVLEKYINNIVNHELNYDKPHKQITDKSILKSITYIIGQWNGDKSKFYQLRLMVLLRTEAEGLQLLKELKKKKEIEGTGWAVEKRTKELDKKMIFLDQWSKPYNFREYF